MTENKDKAFNKKVFYAYVLFMFNIAFMYI